MSRKYKVVDLFCGCGGLSSGLDSTGRFSTEFGVELLPHPAKTFVENIRNSQGQPARVFADDIRKLTESKELFRSELKAAGVTDLDDIDVVAGGPPCNGFSRNGVRKYEGSDQTVRFYDDPRNHLYKDFLVVCDRIRPKVILVENVREFLNFGGGKFSSDLVSCLDEMGYEVSFQKVCAADFGVPQMRHRVFFIAVRKDICDATSMGPVFPRPKFFADAEGFFANASRYRTVRDAISDLPEATLEKGLVPLQYKKGFSGDFAAEVRSDSGYVFNHNARMLSQKQIDRINAVGTGRMRDILDEKLKTKKFYGSAYRRLDWNEPALTITTWVYHVGSGRFAHPDEDRGVTMREAARLQSFGDDFVFPPLVNPASQMIGNAVPPLLAKALASSVLPILDAFDVQSAAA